jgi:uncharacterized protein YbjT (DUF2867 family)
LLRALEAAHQPVRCLARQPEYLRARAAPDTEVVKGDLLDAASLDRALAGVETAFYLVHSMAAGASYAREDRDAAQNFARAARAAGVRRIVYLGALGRGERLSTHLASRQEVGRILRESGVPTIEFRASVVLGSGSLSFDLIRTLVEKLPVMITPSWVTTPTQPIGVEDLVSYLVEAIDLEHEGSAVFEIGGPDRVSYGDLMREYARQRGLRRWMIKVPVLTPRLSSLWLGLVTPIYARVGAELIDGLRNETVVRDDSALRRFPVRPRRVREAIERALANEDLAFAATRWTDAVSAGGRERSWGGVRFGSRLVDARASRVRCPPDQAFAPILRIGGATGWYHADPLWQLRGFLDLLVRGPGLRRGRRDAERLVPGDTVDFWRVEAVGPGRLLRLRAEMRLPGRAWLQFEVEPAGEGSVIHQTAMFDPEGLFGLAYWYAAWPLHQVVFRGMLRGIARAAERDSRPARMKAGA